MVRFYENFEHAHAHTRTHTLDALVKIFVSIDRIFDLIFLKRFNSWRKKYIYIFFYWLYIHAVITLSRQVTCHFSSYT